MPLPAAAPNRLRRWLAGVPAAAVLLALALMLLRVWRPAPGAAHPARVVYAVGMQYSWGISDRPLKTPDEWQAATYAPPVTIRTGVPVDFRVTSFDVDHGFGVYSPSGRLLGEADAIPGHTSDLRLRFTTPGHYWVFCLQVCGMGHHRMRGEFDVVPAEGGR